MRGLTARRTPSPPHHDLLGRAAEALDLRLETDVDRPLALALSGGGDSVALLALTLAWARANGRRVLALTVDHRLQPQSAAWTRAAGERAQALGAAWRALAWTGPKPATGLPAAARAARHALLADAAREAGARVLLLGHTLDDVREGELMRAEGATLGRLRDWAPSPAWPEGRDLFLLRPLLGVARGELREFLRAHGLSWIEDPANADPAFARARARARLAEAAAEADEAGPEPADRAGVAALAAACEADAAGGLTFPRALLEDAAARPFLAAALLCAAGGARPPRGPRLDRMLGRLRSNEAALAATLAGARVEADGETVRLCRDAGETARGGLKTVRIFPGRASVWDGRFEIDPETAGTIAPAQGRMGLLDQEDRKEIRRFMAAARPALPVLLADGGERPVLAWRRARVRSLAGPRLRAACGEIAHERDIADRPRGAVGRASLC